MRPSSFHLVGEPPGFWNRLTLMKRLLASLVVGLAAAGCTTEPADEAAAPTSSPSQSARARSSHGPADLVAPGFRDDCQLVARLPNDDVVYRESGLEDSLGKQIGIADSWCAATRSGGHLEYFPPHEVTH